MLRTACCALSFLVATAATAQNTFDVASIHLSGASVKGERNGATDITHGTLTMHDVTVYTCIHWAYGIPLPLIHGPADLKDVHYDIIAKAAPDTTEEQMRLMMRSLLNERFHLTFHHEKAETRVYTISVAKSGLKMKPAEPGGQSSHQNGKMSMVGHSMTIAELADYLADPLGGPATDKTGLPGRYDFAIDFTPYVDSDHLNNERPDPVVVIKAALKGELGLELVQSKETVDTLVIDHVEPPTAN